MIKSGFSPARTDISLYYQSRTDNSAYYMQPSLGAALIVALHTVRLSVRPSVRASDFLEIRELSL